MKNICFLFIWLAGLSVYAQPQYMERYARIPEEYDAVFVDYCKDFASGIATTPFGQYFGQITPDKNVYGFGSFYTDKDGVVTGQFRRAAFMFGIKMGNTQAKVGSDNHYICYDLLSGDPLYIYMDSTKYVLGDEYKRLYRFESLSYENGDNYIGETRNGMREGLGIYYYVNGDYYYGKYVNNERRGFGAMFKTNNSVTIQFWRAKDDE